MTDPLPVELAAVLHARTDVDSARDALAAAQVWLDLVVDQALAAGCDPAEVRQLGGLT